jgi:hypothetical protein
MLVLVLVLVRIVLVAIGLVVERPLAGRDRVRAGAGDRRDDLADRVSSWSAATTWLMKPQSSAAASFVSPVSSICMDRSRPTARDTGTIGVEQTDRSSRPGCPTGPCR